MMAVRITRSSSDRDISKRAHNFRYTAICSLVNCFEQACLLLPRVQALNSITFSTVLLSCPPGSYQCSLQHKRSQSQFPSQFPSLTSGLELDRTTERKAYEILCPFVQTRASVNQRDLLQNMFSAMSCFHMFKILTSFFPSTPTTPKCPCAHAGPPGRSAEGATLLKFHTCIHTYMHTYILLKGRKKAGQ